MSQVREVKNVCEGHWNRICGEKVKQGGTAIDVMDVNYTVNDFSAQKKKAYKDWKKCKW